jgi:hypothetical protein
MAKPKKPVFAVGDDNVLCIELAVVMHPLVALPRRRAEPSGVPSRPA